MSESYMWLIFGVLVTVLLILDLGLFERKDHVIGIREALLWTAGWIALALAFNVGVYFALGRELAVQFLTGYLLEKSLSMDNLFVFLLIFSYFHVDPKYQHRVLFWGILGALALRAVFIFTGVALLERFEWIIYVFGGFLVVTGIRLGLEKEKKIEPEHNPVLRLLRRVVKVSPNYDGHNFFTRVDGKFMVTPLLVVLVVVETTDLIFALDSIPAVLAISRDSFIVYSSNVFAILGLRALFFALAGVMRVFHHLRYGLAFILAFVGVKMIIHDYYPIPVGAALAVIAAVLVLSVIASLIWPEHKAPSPPA